VAAVFVGFAAVYMVLRHRLLHLGSTGDEASRALPGDDVVPDAIQSTRAITIHAPANAIWPWLVQMGQDKGGFYSYDVLERLSGARIRNADLIHPEWQDLKVGDLVRTYRHVARLEPLGWFVVELQPERALVVRNRTTTWSWALVLEPIDATTTRLIARTRALRRMGPLAKVDLLTGEPAHLVMEIGVLRGVKHRSERTAVPTVAASVEQVSPAGDVGRFTRGAPKSHGMPDRRGARQILR
jgi:hypothetical protein